MYMNVIEIDRLTKSYGKHRGVSDVSFYVGEGDIFGFLGPNGAGKSTAIRSMLGLIQFQEGSIKILGKDIRKHRENILEEVGYMPSEAMFYPQMKVKDIIRMAARARKRDCSAEAAKLCDRLEVDPDKKISDLSLGNRKKVSIVCAMQHKPKLFISSHPGICGSGSNLHAIHPYSFRNYKKRPGSIETASIFSMLLSTRAQKSLAVVAYSENF